MRVLRQVERTLLIIGVLFLTIFFAAHVDREFSYRSELSRFRELQRAALLNHKNEVRTDFRLWSELRIAAYESSSSKPVEEPLGILRVSKVKLEVPVLEGTSEIVLNRAIGHITGTPLPGESGNIGIAGHRDGFFRVLREVGIGDSIELESRNRTDHYEVDRVLIVAPGDTSVLRPQTTSSLTLVTCYPFYFVGSAPMRYIIQASLISSRPYQPVAQQQLPMSTKLEFVQPELSRKAKAQLRRELK